MPKWDMFVYWKYSSEKICCYQHMVMENIFAVSLSLSFLSYFLRDS
jgi:hypothetical protein